MTNRPIKVLHVVNWMDYGGIETWLMHLLRRIDRAEFQFDFCYLNNTPGAYGPEIELLGGKTFPCSRKRNEFIGFSRRMISLFRRNRYDIVHSHTYWLSGLVLRLAHWAGIPVRIAHSHSNTDGEASTVSRNLYRALMKRWILKYATHGLAASADAAVGLFGPDWQSDPRFRVLYCGIDLEPFRQPVSAAEVRRELGIPLDAPVVGHVGNFHVGNFPEQKNHAFLLQIAAEMRRLHPDVRFLLVGDGRLRPHIEARARELGLQDNVLFLGARSDVPRLMLGAMDMFILPSLFEGLGIVLLEAQASGLPCLASTFVPQEAMVVPGAVRFLPLSQGPAGWARVITEILRSGERYWERGLNVFTQSLFSIEVSLKELTALYYRATRFGR